MVEEGLPVVRVNHKELSHVNKDYLNALFGELLDDLRNHERQQEMKNKEKESSCTIC